MYTNYLSAQSVSVRLSYADSQQTRTRNVQNAENTAQPEKESAGKSESSFADMLSIASKDVKPISNIEAYVQDSVNKVLDKIAEYASRALGGQAGEYSVSVTSVSISIEMEEGETIEDVKNELDQMLSEDGYWGVEKTSQRMFDFAAAYAGDNVEELEKARSAVEKGFKQAEAMFGGTLPQISYDTFDAAMEKFDNYIARISNSVSETYA